MNLGIYGGSFNPVHYGHLNVARQAMVDLKLDRLIILPAAVSPFKTGKDAEKRIFPWNRLALVQAAFRDFEKTVVDLRDINRGGVSYAIDSVSEIAAENPGAKIYFIIGEDSVAGLPRWKDIDRLHRLCEFKAYPRTPESSTAIRELFAAAGVTLNPEAKMVETVTRGLDRKGGFCPCRLPKLPEFFCPCDEFKAQLADPEFHGLCHCRLYLKP